MTRNPFKVYSPEFMTAEQVTKLFVPVAEGLEIDGPDHVFIHGHRGCGKSMMLRLMAPDCQILIHNKSLKELPYLGLYATIKATELDVVEYERLRDQYAGIVLAEHSLVAFLGVKTFKSLDEHCLPDFQQGEGAEELRCFVIKQVLPRLASAGVITEPFLERIKTASLFKDILFVVTDALDEAYGAGSAYLRRNAFTSEYLPYQGPLLTYRDFLFPILCELTQLSFMPKGPVYFLLDDADNLNSLQTRVLNTWVSFRTGKQVSFKISTQLAYKTLMTVGKQRIEAPHDFREIHVSSIHTGASSSSNYPQWVEKVVEKRLLDHGIQRGASDFFPEDSEQEEKIRAIAMDIKKQWESKPRGYRANDDAYRYARADYIKGLGGKSKQGSNYRYSGYQQLVHISSGIVRFFLDNASAMYAEQESKLQSKSSGLAEMLIPNYIEPSIQDGVVRAAADNLMFGTLDQLESEAVTLGNDEAASEFKQLRNLIRSLGGIFHQILESDRSERRVFSIALSDDPPEEIMRVLRLGVRHGYFYEAAIGTKEGNWRTKRYVMTRRLAPHFKLDPMGFSGYLFVTTALLQEAITNPKRAVTAFQEDRLGMAVLEVSQLPLGF